jgi:hypothetical protein
MTRGECLTLIFIREPDPNVSCTSQDVFEILRALEDVTGPVVASGKDVYGYLDALSRLFSRQQQQQQLQPQVNGVSSSKKGGTLSGSWVVEGGDMDSSSSSVAKASTQEALRQLDLVRHAAATRLAQCYTLNM